VKSKSTPPQKTAKTPRPPRSAARLNGISSPTTGEVLTLGEAATFLRVAEQEVRTLAEAGQLPGRQFGSEWRILKASLCEWLSKPDRESDKVYHQRLMAMAGSMAHDDTAMEMLEKIYKERRANPVAE